ncbi:MAG: cyanophycinase [Candidatus Nanopelagicales bacterium]
MTVPATRRLMIIGGAEDKLGQRRVLRRFVQYCGGSRSVIAVCATASSLGDEITNLYDKVFRDLGAADVLSVRPVNRAEAEATVASKAVHGATGIFFTGGNQARLAAVLRGTALGDTVRQMYAEGVVVGGTSAGASVVSEHMVALGATGETPKQRMAALAQGLGLLPDVIVDQHFAERGRFGRLLALVAANPSLLGMGVDEDTAAIITNETLLEVYGRGAVFLADGRNAVSNAYAARGTEPILISGASVHFLPSGTHFDLDSRQLTEYRTAVEQAQIARRTSDYIPDRTASVRVNAEGVDDRNAERAVRRRRQRPPT